MRHGRIENTPRIEGTRVCAAGFWEKFSDFESTRTVSRDFRDTPSRKSSDGVSQLGKISRDIFQKFSDKSNLARKTFQQGDHMYVLHTYVH
jgi:hypothetical protein